jgi:hypothetical protein
MGPAERYERASEIAEQAESMLGRLGASAEKANALVNVAHLHLRLAGMHPFPWFTGQPPIPPRTPPHPPED